MRLNLKRAFYNTCFIPLSEYKVKKKTIISAKTGKKKKNAAKTPHHSLFSEIQFALKRKFLYVMDYSSSPDSSDASDSSEVSASALTILYAATISSKRA